MSSRDNREPLLPHQEIGRDWLAARRQAFLADGMRVGKTRQAIAAAAKLNAERILVVCPSIVRTNWGREFAQHWPHAPTVCVWRTSTPSSDWRTISICSYDLAIRNSVRSKLGSQTWDVVILDEAHYLKNPDRQRTCAAYALAKGARCWRLSGTPAPNHYGELYTHLKTAGLWSGSYLDFLDRYCDWYEDKRGNIRVKGNKNHESLRAVLAPFVLRRKLEDVVSELPSMTLETVVVEPAPVDVSKWFPSVALKIDDWSYWQGKIDEENAAVASLLKVSGSGAAGVEALAALQGSRTTTSRRYVGLQKCAPVAEILTAELLANEYAKVVVFAWHKDVIRELYTLLQQFYPVTIFGGTHPIKRDAHVHQFNTKGKCRVFIGQIQAAGVGIDLSVAHEVVFLEQSWVPGDNAQAAMRVHHLKQTHPVRVRLFACADSVDEQVTSMLKRKTKDLTALFDAPTIPVNSPFE